MVDLGELVKCLPAGEWLSEDEAEKRIRDGGINRATAHGLLSSSLLVLGLVESRPTGVRKREWRRVDSLAPRRADRAPTRVMFHPFPTGPGIEKELPAVPWQAS